MTVFVRALYGPFGRSESGIPGGTFHQVDWYFFGIREDNSMGRWCVRFKVRDRAWSAFALPMAEAMRVGKEWMKPEIDPAYVDAYVPDKPMVYGRTYLDILKPRLSEVDIAYAARLLLEATR